MIATKDSIEPQSSDALPNSRRVYVEGTLHPGVRVPFREISLSPTKSFNGELEESLKWTLTRTEFGKEFATRARLGRGMKTSS